MIEEDNREKPSMPRQAAVMGAWVGGISCLLIICWSDSFVLLDPRYRSHLLSYLPAIIPLYPLIVVLIFVSLKVALGQAIEMENLSKRTILQSLAILVTSCLVVVPVVFAVGWEGPAAFAVIAAYAAIGAWVFWLCADWINAWRQSGFRHILFRTLGATYAVLITIMLSFRLLLAMRVTLMGIFGSAVLSLVFVSIGTVVDRILDRPKDQEPAQEVEINTLEAASIVSCGPATYDELKSLRGKYALILIGVVVVSCLLIGPGQLAIQYSENMLLPAIVISIFSALLCAVVTGIYARKVGITHPIIPALIALLPFVPWIALFSVVGYTPIHLKESEPVEDSRSITTKWPIGLLIGFCVGLLPVTVMAILSLVNPRYVGQLFLGPPIGANIPGLPIPCGWPILGMILLGVLLPPVSLGLGFYRRLVRGGWKLLLVIIVLLQCAFPSVWLVMMGPAAIQVYKQFFGGRY